MDNAKPNRSIGAAIGVFFLCDACMILTINVAMAMTVGTYGSSGGLVCAITSVILAAIWKRGSIGTGAAVGISVLIALVAYGLVYFAYA